jgi:phage shock protein E
MINFLELIFGKKVNLKEVILNGAVILDVRTKSEYQSGHIRKSINIPVDNLTQNLKKLNKNRPIITCCASGARSASARRILKSNGFEQVYNGGSWYSLRKYMS